MPPVLCTVSISNRDYLSTMLSNDCDLHYILPLFISERAIHPPGQALQEVQDPGGVGRKTKWVIADAAAKQPACFDDDEDNDIAATSKDAISFIRSLPPTGKCGPTLSSCGSTLSS